MARFVIGPDAVLQLAERGAPVTGDHRLLAPTLLRSQALSLLYSAVREGTITKKEADRRLDFIRRLRIRLLGDRALQQKAWQVAEQLGWPDTWIAEYIALTLLQADAFITLDPALAEAVEQVVSTAPIEALSRP